nr:hypothetical protein [Tanacetum cinerariifolium]
MDESNSANKNCQSSLEIVNIKRYINTIVTGVELCKQKIANPTYYGHIEPVIKNTIEQNFCPVITQINVGLHIFLKRLNKEMVADLRYVNSLEYEVDSLTSQLETQKTQFVNEIDRLSREYYYADHMNAILGVYTELDEVTNLQCSSRLRRFFRYAMFIYSFYLCYVLSLCPFTERYAHPYFFSCLIRQTFKTLCFLNYALMIRHDYDITSSLRRGALQTGLESVEARLLVYKQNESVFEENIKMLNIEVQLRDTALVTLRQKLEASENERDDLKLKLEKFQTSSKNLTAFWPPSNLYDRFVPSGRYHVVPPPYTGTFMPPKPDLVFHTAPSDETEHLDFNVPVSPTKTEQALSSSPNPSAPIIEDRVFDSEEDSEPNDPQQSVPSFAQSSEHVKPPRVWTHLIEDCDFHAMKMAKPAQRNYANRGYYKQYASKPLQHSIPSAVLPQSRHAYRVVTKSKSPIRRHLPPSPSSKHRNSPLRVTAAKTPVASAAKGKIKTWVWRPKYHILDHDLRATSASMTLKRFDYNDALGRSKSVMAWVPKKSNHPSLCVGQSTTGFTT